MAAAALHWIPDSLYNSAVSAVVSHFQHFKYELRTLPENVQFDAYYKLYEKGQLCHVGVELCDLDVFLRLLKVVNKRPLLHRCVQAVVDHGMTLPRDLSKSYSMQNNSFIHDDSIRDRVIHNGLTLGRFLSEAGWHKDSEDVLYCCFQHCCSVNNSHHWRRALDCSHSLLHAQNMHCNFEAAMATFAMAEKIVARIQENNEELPNLAGLYSAFSSLYFSKSHYDKAYRWSLKAISELSASLPPRIVVDVLREGAKSCVVKREFKKAELLIKQAVYLARDVFSEAHPKYASALLDYGFYLLNVDAIQHSVQVYQKALNIQLSVFGGKNLHVAMAHEDLAYALYVHEYSSGRFSTARDHAEKALDIMRTLFHEDHLLLASSKRVKALILEEIAIDLQRNDPVKEGVLLDEAQELHYAALNLSKKAFGERNVQTAKHYGNLGRLYQSMRKFEEAEAMHLKAIEIKESLLGSEDYEVALSIGHLASLYNYDMKQYAKAEQLYMRSINIGCKLFGESYSGLEYDYRGLLQVYTVEGNSEKLSLYTQVLNHWQALRDENVQNQVPPLNPCEQPLPLNVVLERFFQL